MVSHRFDDNLSRPVLGAIAIRALLLAVCTVGGCDLLPVSPPLGSPTLLEAPSPTNQPAGQPPPTGGGTQEDPGTLPVENDPPVAEAQVVGTQMNAALPITLMAADPDEDPLTYSIVDVPAYGAITGHPPDVTYSPGQDYVGFDSFSFQADDGRSGVMSNTANVRIWVIDEEDLSGNTVTGHLLPGGTDVWSFQGVVGQRVTIKVSYGYPRARLSLYPPGGGALETTTRDGWIDWPLQNTGQYTVAVENPWSVSVGYNLSVLVLGAQLASLSDLDGGPITAGETLAGQLAPTGDIDVYTFEGVEGQRVLITISYGYPSARLALYPPGGGELEAWSSNLKIDRMLQTSGLYSIVVVRDVSVTIGYNLTLQQF